MIYLFESGKIGLISLPPYIFCPSIAVISKWHVSASLGEQVRILTSQGIKLIAIAVTKGTVRSQSLGRR